MDKYIKYKKKYLEAKQKETTQASTVQAEVTSQEKKVLSPIEKIRLITNLLKKKYGDGVNIQRKKLLKMFSIPVHQSNEDLAAKSTIEKNRIIRQRILDRQNKMNQMILQIKQIIDLYLKLNDPNNQPDVVILKDFLIYLEFNKRKINRQIMSKATNMIYTINCYNQLIPSHDPEAFNYYDVAKKNGGLNPQQMQALINQQILKSGRKQIKEKKEKEKKSKFLIDKLNLDVVVSNSLKILLSNIIFVETTGVELNGHLIFDNKTRGTMTIAITPPPFLSTEGLYQYLNFTEYENDTVVNYKQWLNMSLLAIKNCVNQLFMTYEGNTKTTLYKKIEDLNSILNVFGSEATEYQTMELIINFVKIVFDSQASDEDHNVKEMLTDFTWMDLIVNYYTV